MGAGLSKAPFDEQGFAFAAQLPDAPKALGAQARTCFFKGVIQEARIVAVRGKDDPRHPCRAKDGVCPTWGKAR